MLVISRKQSQGIRIEPTHGLDPSLTLRELFREGPIVVTLTRVGARRVQLAIKAPAQFSVWREDAQEPGE